MNAELFMNYCNSFENAEECMPFRSDTIVYKVRGKMFALANLEKFPFRFNAKCNPAKSLMLRDAHPEITPGFHMSDKKKWITVDCSGDLREDLIRRIIKHSFLLVAKRQEDNDAI